MKKAIIGVAVAAAIGTGVFLNKDKIGSAAGDVAETQMTEFIEKNINKPIVIEELQSHPFLTQATIIIKEKTDTTIRSEVTLVTVENDNYTIPLNSEIIRGSVDYNNKSFGFGKIVTKPDLSGIKDIPPFITNDTFSLEQYIDLIGNVTEIYKIQPINEKTDAASLDFKGLNVTVDTQLFDRSAFDLQLTFNGLNFNDGHSALEVAPLNYDVERETSGKYTGSSSPMTFTMDKHGKTTTFTLGKGTYKGIHKVIDGIKLPISNIDSTFDTMNISDDKVSITVDNMKISGGTYETSDSSDIAVKMLTSGSFGPEGLPKTLPNGRPMPVTMQSFSFAYELNNITKETANAYYNFAGSMDVNNTEWNEDSIALLKSVQNSNATAKVHATITAAEGSSEASASIALNDSGKALDTEQLVEKFKNGEKVTQLINATLLVTMDKSLADATGLTAAAKMFLHIEPKDDKLTLDGALNNGSATMNGKPVPL